MNRKIIFFEDIYSILFENNENNENKALLKLGALKIRRVTDYAAKLPKNKSDLVLESIIPSELSNENLLQGHLQIGRKKIKSLSVKRRSVMNDEPVIKHGSEGRSKMTYSQVSEIFNFWLNNCIPLPGDRNVKKLSIEDPFLKKDHYMADLYESNGIEIEELNFRGLKKKYFVCSLSIAKNSFKNLSDAFNEEFFNCSFSLFKKYKNWIEN